MVRVRPGPVADFAQAGDEGQARTTVVDVRNVQGLEARRRQGLAEGVVHGRLPAQHRPRAGVTAALGVMQHVDLDLARASVQLHC
ncbi:hypothetical protein D3C80_2058860 [compost metagenome]